MMLNTVTEVLQSPTGRALLEHAHYLEREAQRLGTPETPEGREQQVLYTTLARRARAALRRLEELATNQGSTAGQVEAGGGR